jgi:hypothetical protein
MNQIELDLALDIWHDLAACLNSKEIITINDRSIWDGFLHKWSNRDWELIFESSIMLHDLHPEVFTPCHIDALTLALTAFKNSCQDPRCMDIKNARINNKGIAWRWIMSMREIWNNCQKDLQTQ